MKNLFNESLKVYTGEEYIKEAWRYAEELKQAALAGDFRKADAGKLAEFVRSAVCEPDAHNLCSVLRGVEMPADARADMMYAPSYAVAAAGIYLAVHHRQLISNDTLEALEDMMNATFRHGVVIHGYDDDGLRNKLFAMLGMAGGRVLLERFPAFCPVFAEVMKQYLEFCGSAAWEENSTGIDVNSGGFDPAPQNLALRWAAACWQGKPHAVFTYGTLMRGQRAEDFMETALWGGNCRLRDYAMYDLGSFPGIRKQSGESVLGELWFADDETLAALDRYEGEGDLYLRERVTVDSAYGSLQAYAYVYNREPAGEVLREKWGSTEEDFVWYAAYGSNLSAERFACYIRGGTCSANGRTYSGCGDKRLWTEDRFATVEGRMYFGRESGSWGGGVAFFDANEHGTAIVRLYRITRAQLMDVRQQEGPSSGWYGRVVCLGVTRSGEPVYTLTSDTRHKSSKPSDAYLQLIGNALISEGGISEKETTRYLERCMR